MNYSDQFPSEIHQEKWFLLSIFLGILFIAMLYVIGISTDKAGVTITTVASKMSVIFPISFSLILDNNTNIALLKVIGIISTLLAVFLTLYKKIATKPDLKSIYLPLVLFVGIGLVDSLIKFAQAKYVSNEINPLFTAITFGFAGLTGIFILIFNPVALKSFKFLKTWILGILLGLVNFGTVYFLIGALNHIDLNTGKQTESFAIFGVNNICIVVLSALVGLLVFREKLSKLNWFGISLSLVAIFLLTF